MSQLCIAYCASQTVFVRIFLLLPINSSHCLLVFELLCFFLVSPRGDKTISVFFQTLLKHLGYFFSPIVQLIMLECIFGLVFGERPFLGYSGFILFKCISFFPDSPICIIFNYGIFGMYFCIVYHKKYESSLNCFTQIQLFKTFFLPNLEVIWRRHENSCLSLWFVVHVVFFLG